MTGATVRVLPVALTLLALPPGRPPRSSSPLDRVPLRTVALAPVAIPEEIPDSARAQDAFERLLTDALQRAGVTVVPAHEAGVIWKRLVDSVGGFFSAFTGTLDDVKYNAVQNGTLRELRARFGADALIRPRIWIAMIPWRNGNAKWDGTSEGIGGGGSGTLPALTLYVAMYDVDGHEIYSGQGGIQVMMKTSLLHRDELHDLDPNKLLTDEGRNRKAVQLALDSLAAVVARSRAP
ncbi:MAG TPA: hypothetical protein VFK78_12340 [Gemmatimonadales bacterium]|nr:hypothetical protein [Gemmatimonadales bacterium]